MGHFLAAQLPKKLESAFLSVYPPIVIRPQLGKETPAATKNLLEVRLLCCQCRMKESNPLLFGELHAIYSGKLSIYCDLYA
jgi:hypothetical protein